jgi:hypothetical protein
MELDALPVAPVDKHDAERENRAREICGQLLIDRWVAKRQCRDLLLDDELRAMVGRRLDGVGLELVESFTSDYFAVRLRRDIEADIRLDWATNARVPRGAVALLVILWAKLVLPKRIASTDAALKRQNPDAPVDPNAPVEDGPISLPRAALYAEFGRKFGMTAFARYLGQLKTAGFIREDRRGNLSEGPVLDLLIDGVQMAQKLRDSVLWDVLERGGIDAPEPAETDDGDDDLGDDED